MDQTMRLAWQVYSLPKKGHAMNEYEDASAVDGRAGRFAVADGASESAFASSWAKILVQGYIRHPGSWSGWLPAARKRWRSRLKGQALSWYAETLFAEGAFAALLGLAFENQSWQAEAVGDSCLFQIRHQRLLQAFPLKYSADFGNQPALLGSRARKNQYPRTRRHRTQGDWQKNDLFFLMTDALAQWFLKKVEAQQNPWKDLQAIAAQEQFDNWVERSRSSRELRNDDVTLVMIQT